MFTQLIFDLMILSEKEIIMFVPIDIMLRKLFTLWLLSVIKSYNIIQYTWKKVTSIK